MNPLVLMDCQLMGQDFWGFDLNREQLLMCCAGRARAMGVITWTALDFRG